MADLDRRLGRGEIMTLEPADILASRVFLPAAGSPAPGDQA